ncbi:MAG: YqjK family protein [Gallionella sp.]|nr:YqjK family protein [Gallionella sp.]
MKRHLNDILARRYALLIEIQHQKVAMEEIAQQFKKPLAVVDAGVVAVSFIRRHPALVSSGFAVLLALRHRNFANLKQHGANLLRLLPATIYLTQFFSREPHDK